MHAEPLDYPSANIVNLVLPREMVMAKTIVKPYAPKITNHAILKRPQRADQPAHNGYEVSRRLIGEAMRRRIGAIEHEVCHPGDEDAFFVADLGEVYRQHLRWKKNLPRVKPFYAVKCNPDYNVIRLLAELGAGFDCASKAEIEQVLTMGVNPDKIIYAQPCKTSSYLRFVRSAAVKKMTFDNADELVKISKLYPDAELYLRIMTDDTSSQCRLSMKFGAPMDTTDSLLATAKRLKLNVVGVSFHVGSGASDPMAFFKAVRDASFVFQQGLVHGYELKTLDIGGGFCSETFEPMAAAVNEALDEFFPVHHNVDIIAEPGRFYVSTAFTIACNIIARRTVEDPSMAETGYMIYMNDGVYGNFSCIMFDHYNPMPKVLRAGEKSYYDTPYATCTVPDGVPYSIWGPTCDGIDRIADHVRFDQVLDVGDWLYFDNMGAYTKCSATAFNGFTNEHDVIYVCSEPGAMALLDNAAI